MPYANAYAGLGYQARTALQPGDFTRGVNTAWRQCCAVASGLTASALEPTAEEADEPFVPSAAVRYAAEQLHALTTTLKVFDPDTADADVGRQELLADLVWEFEDIFTTDPSVVLANSDVEHSIHTGSARPRQAASSRAGAADTYAES